MTEKDWLVSLFADENCAECHGGADAHTVVPVLGNPFARCNPVPPEAIACRFCFHNLGVTTPATRLAPQIEPENPATPATWVPVCEDHFSDWYDDCTFGLPFYMMGES